MEEAAEAHDQMIQEAVGDICRLGPPSQWLERVSTQVSLPVSLGGLGVRPAWSVRQPAFIASFQEAFRLLRGRYENATSVFLHEDIWDGLSTVAAVSESLAYLKALGVGHAQTNALQSARVLAGGVVEDADVQEEAAGGDGHGGEPGVGRKLQKELTRSMEEIEYRKWLNSHAGKSDKKLNARLLSGSSRHAGTWVVVVPTRREHRLSNAEFIFSVRHRLVLPQGVMARLFQQQCVCGHKIEDKIGSHYNCCGKSVYRTRLHNELVKVVQSLAKKVGYLTDLEVHVGRMRLGEAQPNPSASCCRLDLTLTPPAVAVAAAAQGNQDSKVLSLDVTVTSEVSDTAVNRDKSNMLQGRAAFRAEQKKNNKYKAIVESPPQDADVDDGVSYQFIPLALEMGGAAGQEFQDLIKRLSSRASRNVAAEGYEQWYVKSAGALFSRAAWGTLSVQFMRSIYRFVSSCARRDRLHNGLEYAPAAQPVDLAVVPGFMGGDGQQVGAFSDDDVAGNGADVSDLSDDENAGGGVVA
jgi:hypothetical protein